MTKGGRRAPFRFAREANVWFASEANVWFAGRATMRFARSGRPPGPAQRLNFLYLMRWGMVESTPSRRFLSVS
ncbi:hypothetical protein GMJLKIPL_0615 [Methylobacterium isbiliense]|jgi:hypothetical protein|uniref:Uncharacterized protein n=1 Tax=Methylobacterium isbiliense TaxID=315478 RepID=A0ABQ4S8A3_9HYPH|nr:hypothetical protein GMJLKIPL_0615 [Methylobacterium isbiliense]